MKDWSLDYINEHFASEGKVACEVTEKKGRIINSRRGFRPGDVIFEERPLHIVTEEPHNEAFKLIRRLCKKDPDSFFQEPLWYWAAVCSLTAEQLRPGPRKGSIRSVEPDQQRRLLCLYHEPVEEASEAVALLVEQLRLNVSAVLVEELLQAWVLNCFDHSEEPQGYAAYFGSSFMSHSCRPNAIWAFAEGTQAPDTFVLRARSEIRPGDEICITYVSEQVLMQAAATRKRELHSTKQFVCTCERCGPGAPEADQCRGFRCPRCGGATVFHPGPLAGAALSEAVCPSCKAPVGDLGAWLLKEEAWLLQKLSGLDQQVQKRAISGVLAEKDVQQLLAKVGDSECGSVGPQHWLCNELWGHLADWYDQTGRREDARRMVRLKVEYQRKAYPGLNGELAWTLEGLAEVTLRHLGVEPRGKCPPHMDEAARQRAAAHVLPLLDEAAAVLGQMFGELHEYFRDVDEKRAKLARYLERAG